MNDLIIILEYLFEKIFKLLKNDKFTIICSLILSVIIAFIQKLDLLYIHNLINNRIFNLICISIILYLYSINNIIGNLLFILYLNIYIILSKKYFKKTHTKYDIVIDSF